MRLLLMLYVGPYGAPPPFFTCEILSDFVKDTRFESNPRASCLLSYIDLNNKMQCPSPGSPLGACLVSRLVGLGISSKNKTSRVSSPLPCSLSASWAPGPPSLPFKLAVASRLSLWRAAGPLPGPLRPFFQTLAALNEFALTATAQTV